VKDEAAFAKANIALIFALERKALIKNTEQTTNKIRSKTAQANNIAIAIAQAAGKKPPVSLTAAIGAASKKLAEGGE
jgi:hypothetical protein